MTSTTDYTYKDPAKGWRTRCCVIGCRRSRAGRWSWICCAQHWRPVRRDLKLLRTRIKKRFRRRGEITDVHGGWYPNSDRAKRALDGVDRRLIRDAIEKAVGL